MVSGPAIGLVPVSGARPFFRSGLAVEKRGERTPPSGRMLRQGVLAVFSPFPPVSRFRFSAVCLFLTLVAGLCPEAAVCRNFSGMNRPGRFLAGFTSRAAGAEIRLPEAKKRGAACLGRRQSGFRISRRKG